MRRRGCGWRTVSNSGYTIRWVLNSRQRVRLRNRGALGFRLERTRRAANPAECLFSHRRASRRKTHHGPTLRARRAPFDAHRIAARSAISGVAAADSANPAGSDRERVPVFEGMDVKLGIPCALDRARIPAGSAASVSPATATAALAAIAALPGADAARAPRRVPSAACARGGGIGFTLTAFTAFTAFTASSAVAPVTPMRGFDPVGFDLKHIRVDDHESDRGASKLSGFAWVPATSRSPRTSAVTATVMTTGICPIIASGAASASPCSAVARFTSARLLRRTPMAVGIERGFRRMTSVGPIGSRRAIIPIGPIFRDAIIFLRPAVAAQAAKGPVISAAVAKEVPISGRADKIRFTPPAACPGVAFM